MNNQTVIITEHFTCPDCGQEMTKTEANDPRDDGRIVCKCNGCGNIHIVFR